MYFKRQSPTPKQNTVARLKSKILVWRRHCLIRSNHKGLSEENISQLPSQPWC